MFSSGPAYTKLKTNLRLCINRLKLLEKKKTELALKSRKEIADYMAAGKVERAKIRVEHIIREDYLVEAMELLEMFCDLLLARFGLIQQMKTLDEGLAEAISSIIWVAPRLQSDVAELKIVAEQLAAKYGKPYALACRENGVGTVSEKLMHKLSVQAPPKITVEKYMIEIAKYYSVDYEPDTQVLSQDEQYAADALIDLAPAPPLPDKNDLNKGNGGGGGGGGAAVPPVPGASAPHPQAGYSPFQYPPAATANSAHPPVYGGGAGAMPYPPPGEMTFPSASNGYNIPLNASVRGEDGPPPYFPPDVSAQPALPPAAPAAASGPPPVRSDSQEDNNMIDFPELPGVPSDSPLKSGSPVDEKKDDDIDFDDLSRRFEALKKKK